MSIEYVRAMVAKPMSPAKLAEAIHNDFGNRSERRRFDNKVILDVGTVVERLEYITLVSSLLGGSDTDRRGRHLVIKIDPQKYLDNLGDTLVLYDNKAYTTVYATQGQIVEADNEMNARHDRHNIDPSEYYFNILKTLLDASLPDEGIQDMFTIQLMRLNRWVKNGRRITI